MSAKLPLLGFAAYSGTGKTTLLVSLIPLLRQAGVRVAVIKHAHHPFDIDIPGKDSYRLRHAGAWQTLIASDRRVALMLEKPNPTPPVLAELVAKLDPDLCDMVLVEGFKEHPIPKLELHRAGLDKPLCYPCDPHIIAIVTDDPATIAVSTSLPVLPLNAPSMVADFICDWLQHQTCLRC